MQPQDQNATVTTGTPRVTHEGGDTVVKTVVTTVVHDDDNAGSSGDTGTASDTAGPIGGGATQADYDAPASSDPFKPFVDDRAHQDSNVGEAKNDQDQQRNDNMSVEPYLTKVVDDEHRARVARIVDQALDKCGVDRGELIKALQRETLQDNRAFLEIIVELIRRSHMTVGSSYVRMTGRAPGFVSLEMPGAFGAGQVGRSVNLMAMADGSIRVRFLNGKVIGQTDLLVEDTPDADANVIVNAAYNWLQNAAAITSGFTNATH